MLNNSQTWIESFILRNRPTVILPLKLRYELKHIGSLIQTEFSAFLEMRQLNPDLYTATSWYVPYQTASGGSTDLTKKGAVALATEMLDKLENLYGVYHIHPGFSNTASMSTIDINCMWDWVKNSKQGVFIVSSQFGDGLSAILVEKVGHILCQTPMDVKIDLGLSADEDAKFKELVKERISSPVYVTKVTKHAKKQRKKGVLPLGKSSRIIIQDEFDYDNFDSQWG